MSQHDLATATGYSRSLIGALEQNQRLPDIDAVVQIYVPALGLQDEPLLAAQLVKAAAAVRGERLPSAAHGMLHNAHSLAIQDDPSAIESAEEKQRLPHPPTVLVGRDEAVEHLCRRLQGHMGRLLTLTGPPGVGKTRLALGVGAKLQWTYKHGACFVPLAAVTQPVLVASALVTALKLRDHSNERPESRAIKYLRRREVLLILDNFEQVLAAAPFVGELLAECGGLHILVTSRERLHLRAEQRYRVPPLVPGAAAELFCERAAAVDGDFELTPANRTAIDAICRQLDCLPLALELCAAQVDLLTPAQLLAHLQERPLDVLVGGAQDLPAQHRTLRVAIQHSYDLLDKKERQLLRCLSVLTGGGDLAASAGMSDWEHGTAESLLLPTLHALVGKNLIHVETTAGGVRRFVLLETIREFGLEQVRAQGEEETLRARHCATYLKFARAADAQLRGPEAADWFARLDAEQDNLRAALRWAIEKGRYADAAWLVLVASSYWNSCGMRAEGAGWLAQLLPHRRVLPDNLRLAILLWAYAFATVGGPVEPEEQHSDEVIELLENYPEMLLQAAAWRWMATTMPSAAESNRASERSVVLAQAAYDLPALGVAWGLLGDQDFILAANLSKYANHLIDQGQLAQAAPLAAQSLELFRRRGNRTGVSEALAISGWLALFRGDLDEAHTLVQQSMSVITTFQRLSWRLDWQFLFGLVTLYRGNPGEARKLLADSLNLYVGRGQDAWAARVCTYLADAVLWEGNLGEAEQWLVQSLGWDADPTRITLHEVERIFVAARLAAARRQHQRAAKIFGLVEQAHAHVHHVDLGPQQRLAEMALGNVRSALDSTIFALEFASGRQLPFAEAFATLLAPDA